MDDLFAQFDTEARANGLLAPVNEPTNIVRRRAAVVHNEVAVRRRDACAADGEAFEASAIDQCTRKA